MAPDSRATTFFLPGLITKNMCMCTPAVSCRACQRIEFSSLILYCTRNVCAPCVLGSLPIDALFDLPRIHNKSHRSVVDQRHVHHRTKDSVLDLVRLTIFARN